MVIKVLNLDKCISKFREMKNIDCSPVIKEATQRVQQKAKDISPKDTGTLRNSIKRMPIRGSYKNGGKVYVTTEYAIYQEFGVSHGWTIRPKTPDGWLKWKDKNGLWHKAKEVHIKGLKSHPFMRPALGSQRSWITSRINSYIKEQLTNISKK